MPKNQNKDEIYLTTIKMPQTLRTRIHKHLIKKQGHSWGLGTFIKEVVEEYLDKQGVKS